MEIDIERMIGRTTINEAMTPKIPNSPRIRQVEVARTFRITRKVTLPMVIRGKRFILPAGVPEPDGDLSGVRIIRE